MRKGERVKAISICIQCGAQYHRWGGDMTSKYCSRKCALASRRTFEPKVKREKLEGL